MSAGSHAGASDDAAAGAAGAAAPGGGAESAGAPTTGGWEATGGATAHPPRCAPAGFRCLAGADASEGDDESWESGTAGPNSSVTARADFADDGSTLSAINNVEQIVGTDSCGHAILIEPNGQVVDLLADLNISGSRAIDINDAGAVVGVTTPSPDASEAYPFIWEDGVATVLTDFPGASPLAVNAKRQILLLLPEGGGGLWHEGVFTELGEYLLPFDLNNHGLVVGARTIAEGETLGFRWSDGNVEDLPQLRLATAVNDAGTILGRTSTSDAILDGDRLTETYFPTGALDIAADGSVLGLRDIYVNGSIWPLTRNDSDGTGFDWHHAVAFNDHHVIVGVGATWVITHRGSCSNDQCGYEKTFGAVWKRGCFGACCGDEIGGGGAAGATAAGRAD